MAPPTGPSRRPHKCQQPLLHPSGPHPKPGPLGTGTQLLGDSPLPQGKSQLRLSGPLSPYTRVTARHVVITTTMSPKLAL